MESTLSLLEGSSADTEMEFDSSTLVDETNAENTSGVPTDSKETLKQLAKPKKKTTIRKHKAKKAGRSKNKGVYRRYVYRLMKSMLPDNRISPTAMLIMESFLQDIFERIASEAGRLVKYNKRRTLTSRDIQTAVRLIVPGELNLLAVEEGVKAVSLYMKNK